VRGSRFRVTLRARKSHAFTASSTDVPALRHAVLTGKIWASATSVRCPGRALGVTVIDARALGVSHEHYAPATGEEGAFEREGANTSVRHRRHCCCTCRGGWAEAALLQMQRTGGITNSRSQNLRHSWTRGYLADPQAQTRGTSSQRGQRRRQPASADLRKFGHHHNIVREVSALGRHSTSSD
jgi:hypothetical protein